MRIHIVQKGDTLWKIAKEYGISFEDLKRLNVHLANPDYIVPGMEIILPEKIHKEAPVHPRPGKENVKESVKESVKKEVPRPTPPPVPVAPVPPPMPMPEPQMIPIPIPMPMQQPPIMWMPQPVELSWHQQLVMPQVEQPVLPPIQIQTPPPAPKPAPPPVAKPAPKPVPTPKPTPQQPIHVMPQMPVVPQCPSCHQPVHHQMFWPMPMPPHGVPCSMPMPPQVMPYPMPMPAQEAPCSMPATGVAGTAHYLESSPFSAMFDVNNPHGQQGSPSCGSQPPAMMPNWQFDHCNCPQMYPSPCSQVGQWMSPHFFPGEMTPYRW